MFKSLFELLKTLIKNNNKTMLGQVMAGAGIGLSAAVGLNKFADYYKEQAIEKFGELNAISGLLGLAGVDKAVSVIIGAYLCAIYIKTFVVGLKVVAKK